MTRFVLSLPVALSCVASVLLSSPASAQDTQTEQRVVVEQGPTPNPAPGTAAPVTAAPVVQVEARPRYEYSTGPDPKLLRNGLWTLSVMYVTSVAVAIASPRPSDDYLFIPVAGPWLDLNNRGASGANDGKYETLFQALLIADGVIQGIGAAKIVLSLIFPETRLVEQTRSAATTSYAVRARPMIGRGSFGLSAYGAF